MRLNGMPGDGGLVSSLLLLPLRKGHRMLMRKRARFSLLTRVVVELFSVSVWLSPC